MEVISCRDFDHLSRSIRENHREATIVIWDAQVKELYAPTLQLKNDKWISFVVGPGETCKSFDVYKQCLEAILEKNINRKTHVLAIGGGATSDLAGFIAATVLRGIAWSVVPTTLLAQVDAAIGGKVAINSFHGKNLIGQFHFPKRLYLCPPFLQTLPDLERQSGYGEIIKYCLLSPAIFDLVVKKYPMDQVINACIKYKREIVARDPYEKKERKILNFGHTFGHGFEQKYRIPHGIAVLHGINFVIENFGDEKKKFSTLLDHFGIVLDNKLCLTKSDVRKWCLKDKKNSDNQSIDIILNNPVRIAPTPWKHIIDKSPLP